MPRTARVVAACNLRPHWVWHTRRPHVHWRTGKVNNHNQLTALGLWEPTQLAHKEYGVEEVDQYRTLVLNDAGEAEWVLWRVKPGTDGVEMDDFEPVSEVQFMSSTGEVATFLPVAVAHTGKTDSMMVASIPLIDVAWANLGHWQEATNLRFYRAVASFGQPVLVGELVQRRNSEGEMVAGELGLGPVVVIQLEEGGSFSWEAQSAETFKPLQAGVDLMEAHLAVAVTRFVSWLTGCAEQA